MSPCSSPNSNLSTNQFSPVNSEISQQGFVFKAITQERTQVNHMDDETLSSYSQDEEQESVIRKNNDNKKIFGFIVPDFFNDKTKKDNSIQEKLQKYNEVYESFDGIDPDLYMIPKETYLEKCFFD